MNELTSKQCVWDEAVYIQVRGLSPRRKLHKEGCVATKALRLEMRGQMCSVRHDDDVELKRSKRQDHIHDILKMSFSLTQDGGRRKAMGMRF